MKEASAALDNILTRRSIRAFTDTALCERDIDLMLRCLEAAPSAGNLQPWRFIVIRNAHIKERLCALSFDQKALVQAPVVFAITAKPQESSVKYGELGASFFCIQDTAAAVQNLQLAAHALGYGAVWIGIVRENEIRTLLNLSEDERPIALVPVGIAAESAPKMERRPLQEIVSYRD
jgi:nitroreductase